MNVLKSAPVSLLLLFTGAHAATNHMNSTVPLATAASESAAQAASTADNPLMPQSTLPYQLPTFDKIGNQHYGPAIEAGMAEQKREVEAIARNPAAPTFENTIITLERSGEMLAR